MTSGRDAEAERLRSFYLCDRRRTLSLFLETLLWTCWNCFFVPSAVDKTSRSLVFFPKRTSHIYALNVVYPRLFSCYTTDAQTFPMHFDVHVIVQYKGEANVRLSPKPVDSIHFTIISFICNRIKNNCILIKKMHSSSAAIVSNSADGEGMEPSAFTQVLCTV